MIRVVPGDQETHHLEHTDPESRRSDDRTEGS